MERERYDDNAYWRERYLRLVYDFAEANEELMNKVVSLQQENKRLKRENWNLKKTKGKIK
ncbi:hypothetical protein AB3329_07890 [Streptococcus sp. H31]|uniref:hypothetical protein n=1 Tax=Streptococcus huangxiaojuni TaxID=3237239 RepID=UPI0034A3ABE0